MFYLAFSVRMVLRATVVALSQQPVESGVGSPVASSVLSSTASFLKLLQTLRFNTSILAFASFI